VTFCVIVWIFSDKRVYIYIYIYIYIYMYLYNSIQFPIDDRPCNAYTGLSPSECQSKVSLLKTSKAEMYGKLFCRG